MATKNALLSDLQKTAKEYVTKEKERLENEAKVLEAVLNGRTGGKGIQAANTKVVAAVAQANLKKYLAME